MKKYIIVLVAIGFSMISMGCDVAGTGSIESRNDPSIIDSLTLQDRMFFGTRTPTSLRSDDMGEFSLLWYYYTFGIPFYGLSSTFENIVGIEVVNSWIDTLRDENGAAWGNIRDFIDYFGLTVEDFIVAEESVNGVPMKEADAIIIWARDVTQRPLEEILIDENGNDAFLWSHRLTTAEIKAFFSDCVYEIWEHFPGYGVLHNGNVYSPEWIMQNIGYAILKEDIPIDEVERILEKASNFPDLEMKVELALEELETAREVLDSK